MEEVRAVATEAHEPPADCVLGEIRRFDEPEPRAGPVIAHEQW
jgi:hypothetical protein